MTVVERGYCSTVTRRRAAKVHRCECGQGIPKGQVYLLHKGFPGHDALSNITAPVTMAECFRCAERYGRDYLLGPDAPDPVTTPNESFAAALHADSSRSALTAKGDS